MDLDSCVYLVDFHASIIADNSGLDKICKYVINPKYNINLFLGSGNETNGIEGCQSNPSRH